MASLRLQQQLDEEKRAHTRTKLALREAKSTEIGKVVAECNGLRRSLKNEIREHDDLRKVILKAHALDEPDLARPLGPHRHAANERNDTLMSKQHPTDPHRITRPIDVLHALTRSFRWAKVIMDFHVIGESADSMPEVVPETWSEEDRRDVIFWAEGHSSIGDGVPAVLNVWVDGARYEMSVRKVQTMLLTIGTKVLEEALRRQRSVE